MYKIKNAPTWNEQFDFTHCWPNCPFSNWYVCQIDSAQSINQLLNVSFSDEDNYELHDLQIANEPGLEHFKYYDKSEAADAVDVITVLVDQQEGVGINTNKVQKSIGK